LFRLTKSLIQGLKRKGQFKGKCFNCGRKLGIDDFVLSKASITRGHYSRKWYCLGCASKLNIWVKR